MPKNYASVAAWRERNREKWLAQKRRYRQRNKTKEKERHKRRLAQLKSSGDWLGLIRATWADRRIGLKDRGVPVDIAFTDIEWPTHCPVLGLPLDYRPTANAKTGWSLDRFIPALGYVKGNVHVISRHANTIKSDATYTEVQAVADWLARVEDRLLNAPQEIPGLTNGDPEVTPEGP